MEQMLKFIKKLKRTLEKDEDITGEQVEKYSQEWFNFADIDGNGLIDYKEFEGLINKLDENKKIPQGEIKN